MGIRRGYTHILEDFGPAPVDHYGLHHWAITAFAAFTALAFTAFIARKPLGQMPWAYAVGVRCGRTLWAYAVGIPTY